MVLLAVDTSGRDGSLALGRVTPGQPEIELLEVVPLAGGTFSAQLVPQIRAQLEKHVFRKSDIVGLAVVSGPGSFTGLRVGLAAVKALAEILRKPIAAVSLLEAIARSGSSNGRVVAVVDAGRNEVYAGVYELAPTVRMVSERLLNREEFAAQATRSTVVTPDAGIADALRSGGFRVEHVVRPSSGDIARLGWERIERGETVLPEELDANYIRRSDAEIFSKPKI